MAIGHQSFYQTALTSGISASDLIIPLDTVPTVSEGFLVIESTVQAKREIIYFTSKDATTVTCPSGAGNGRGYDGTTAVSHLQGATVIMAPVGAMFEKLGDITVNSITIADTTSAEGWSPLGATPDTVTANGNKSYDLVFNSNDLTDTITPGMRLRTARTVAAPIQCASLNGTTQFFNRLSASLAGMTFTDDFSVSAWVKLSNYGAQSTFASRYNGTSGWRFFCNSSGQVYLQGQNGGSTNYRRVITYQSLPLNRWVHVTAQLDMSTYTATTTTCYVMFNGVDVPVQIDQGGTNPTALVQAGNLEIGAENGGTNPFPGKLAQVAIYSAKVTQATHLAAMNQGLTGSESNLAAGYSLSNSLNDLSPNANNLSAQGSAVATNADSPFGNAGVSTTYDYGIVMAASFSTNTTLTVQVPEGCTIPTSGGVSTVDYSTQATPYGFPRAKGKWLLETIAKAAKSATGASTTWYEMFRLTIPIGSWIRGYEITQTHVGVSATRANYTTLGETSAASSEDPRLSTMSAAGPVTDMFSSHNRSASYTTSTQKVNYLNARVGTNASNANALFIPSTVSDTDSRIYAENAYL